MGEVDRGEGGTWRAGGLLIQHIAGDEDARDASTEPWDKAQALFETIGEDELVDPTVSGETLLYRLFHEDGVRLFSPRALRASAAARPSGSTPC